jgi:hypothetical protein
MSQVHPLYRAIFDGDCKRIDALLTGHDVNQRIPREIAVGRVRAMPVRWDGSTAVGADSRARDDARNV